MSNQHILTSAYPGRPSTTIGAYMVFYSLGSSLGAAATTTLFDAVGWTGPTVLGAAFALCALATWALSGSWRAREPQSLPGGCRDALNIHDAP
ncbi:hypothetical protein GCM10023350_36770 [Nocardioides endophyticus]|uniref:MFS transporter n=1 Tax=Nocardioides endophyticus TaxID=1353775 RepID=A0ABP8Z798_9ACTN